MEKEKVEAENLRIKEFANYQQIVEEARMAKIREREAAKQLLYKKVKSPLNCLFLMSVCVFGIKKNLLWSFHSCLTRWKKRISSVRPWTDSASSSIWRNRKRLPGRKRL